MPRDASVDERCGGQYCQLCAHFTADGYGFGYCQEPRARGYKKQRQWCAKTCRFFDRQAVKAHACCECRFREHGKCRSEESPFYRYMVQGKQSACVHFEGKPLKEKVFRA